MFVWTWKGYLLEFFVGPDERSYATHMWVDVTTCRQQCLVQPRKFVFKFCSGFIVRYVNKYGPLFFIYFICWRFTFRLTFFPQADTWTVTVLLFALLNLFVMCIESVWVFYTTLPFLCVSIYFYYYLCIKYLYLFAISLSNGRVLWRRW